MKIYSFTEKAYGFQPIEVEMTFMPGLPKFHIMGLPDTVIKESEFRIRSALQHQGFQLPTSQQVLINLKPPHQKKSSRGLELAIACAYLWKSGQVPQPGEDEVFVYGELSLSGEVIALETLEVLNEEGFSAPLITGSGNLNFYFNYLSVADLRGLEAPELVPASKSSMVLKRPDFSEYKVSSAVAELIKVIALGEHSAFFAGPAGSGKTTLAKMIPPLLAEPDQDGQRSLRKISRWFNEELIWRPLVAPHHTTPTHAMIGGGVPPVPGELTRAHGGILLLDEYLEFAPRVKEALREPIESGEITLARLRHSLKLPADFLLLATTNLCPCGKFVPGKMTSCRFSLQRCRSYMEKLSGPMLDRFAIVSFSSDWVGDDESGVVSMEAIYRDLGVAREFQKRRGQSVPNAKLNPSQILQKMDEFTRDELLPKDLGSRRRLGSILRVARTFADLSQSPHIRGCDIESAMSLSYRPFLEIEQIYA